MHSVEIPTKKGEHLWKCTELSLKRKEGIEQPVRVLTIDNIFRH